MFVSASCLFCLFCLPLFASLSFCLCLSSCPLTSLVAFLNDDSYQRRSALVVSPFWQPANWYFTMYAFIHSYLLKDEDPPVCVPCNSLESAVVIHSPKCLQLLQPFHDIHPKRVIFHAINHNELHCPCPYIRNEEAKQKLRLRTYINRQYASLYNILIKNSESLIWVDFLVNCLWCCRERRL